MLLFLSLLAMAAGQPDPDTAPPVPGEWAWLNIPDMEGPGARFSYETAVHRTGQRIEIRLRYNEADPARPRRAAVPVEARILLDCAARTSQMLARQPRARTHQSAPAALVAPNTREAVLMRLLCPAGVRPIPPTASGQEG